MTDFTSGVWFVRFMLIYLYLLSAIIAFCIKAIQFKPLHILLHNSIIASDDCRYTSLLFYCPGLTCYLLEREIVAMWCDGNGFCVFVQETKGGLTKCPTPLKKVSPSLLKHKVRTLFPLDNMVSGGSGSFKPQGPHWGQLFF